MEKFDKYFLGLLTCLAIALTVDYSCNPNFKTFYERVEAYEKAKEEGRVKESNLTKQLEEVGKAFRS